MLPSSGYFKSAVCPFYKSGLCERPHCHYKHAKADSVGNVSVNWTSGDEVEQVVSRDAKPDLFSILSNADSKLVEENPAVKPLVTQTYIPTPVTKCIGKPPGILKASKPEKPAVSIPEYKPTPVPKTITSQWDQEDSNSTTSLNAGATGKRKRVEEYDPEEVKFLTKKKVCFNLGDDDVMILEDTKKGLHDVVTIEDDESPFEEDELETDAKFSDDDDFENNGLKGWGTSKFGNIETAGAEPKTETVIKEEKDDEEEEEEEEKISKYSLVDRILVDVNKNQELIQLFNRPKKCNANAFRKVDELDRNVDNKLSKSNVETVPSLKKLDKKSSENSVINKEKVSEIVPNESEKTVKNSSKTKLKETTKTLENKSENEPETGTKESKKSSDKTKVKNLNDVLKETSVNKDESKSSGKSEKDSKSAKDSTTKSKVKLNGNSHKVKKSKSDSKDLTNSTTETSAKSKSDKHKHEKQKSDSRDHKKHKSDSHEHKKHKSDSHEPKKTEKDSVKDKEKKNETGKEAKSSEISKKDKSSKDTTSKSSKDKTSESSKDKTSKSSNDKHLKKSSSSSKSSHGHEKVSTSKTIQDGKITSSSLGKTLKESEGFLSGSEEVKKPKSDKHVSVSGSSKHKKTLETKAQASGSKSLVVSSSKCSKVVTAKDKPAVVSSSKRSKSSESASSKTSESASSDILSDGVPDSDHLVSSDSEFDSDTYEECWRIFNETQSSGRAGSMDKEGDSGENHEMSGDMFLSGKKRLAHNPDFKKKMKPNVQIEAKKHLNPAQVMHNRYLQLQEMYAKQNEQREASAFLSSLNKSVGDSQKKRIGFVSNPTLLAAVLEKNKSPLMSTSSNKLITDASDSSHTVVTTVKGAKRSAHVPNIVTKPRPIIPSEYGSRVPSNIRQRYLNSFIDECLKFCLSEDQAYEMSLEEEKRAYERSTNKAIYMNVAANALNRLRHRSKKGPPAELPDVSIPADVTSTTPAPEKLANRTVSHETVLAGARAQKLSYSIEKKKSKTTEFVFKGAVLFKALRKYLLSPEQLIENGFPLPHPTEAGRAVMAGIYANRQTISNDQFKRACSRCQKTYYVDESGDYVKNEECEFHWGRIYKRRIAGSIESRHTCCQGDAESDGCSVGPGHVFDGSDNHILKGFVKTLPKTPPPDKYYGVYSLDCEMCYTTAGIELTRVTVISPDMKSVFETYVKPEHKVLDYNTRFSGITEEDLEGITTSIRDVQAILLCMFNDKTILIGHSLESDFKALKLIHRTVVDTSVVFPHKLGVPYKRALRTLMAEKCNKIIQNNIGGHDSHEDAAACMELMLWKLKEDFKYSSR